MKVQAETTVNCYIELECFLNAFKFLVTLQDYLSELQKNEMLI